MADDDRQVREAAEALLNGSINSHRSSYTQPSIPRTPDIILSEDLIAGARVNGRMSNVRRFFCLFVTFDLVFTCLLWLICTMIAGESLQTAFDAQVVHYHIKTSLFDIVMAAICRFTVLLLFYALLYLNHWIIVAISTTVTSAFLLAKVFLFDWTTYNQPVFQVILIISSFVLAWSEAWFFDFRVRPQELQSRNWFRNASNSERSPLLPGPSLHPHHYHSIDPVSTFFTPMDSPDLSDDENTTERKQDHGKSSSASKEPFLKKPYPQLSHQKIEDHKRRAQSLLKSCYELLTSTDWKEDSKTPNGDIISYMPKGNENILKIEGVVDLPARKLINWLFETIDESCTWNKFVSESTRIQQIDDNTDIVYQATSSHGGGIIGARDFVILRHRGKYENYYISSGVSVPFDGVPNRKSFIRGENGVGCWAAQEIVDGDNTKCIFTWVLNTNMKGWIPQKIINKSMLSTYLPEFLTFLRDHLRTIEPR